jgi:hypothetical protein
MMAYIITVWYDADEAVQGWVGSLAIFFGFIIWIFYLRAIKATRSFIRALVVIIIDMRSFMLVLTFLLAGFTLIYQVFQPEKSFVDNMLDTYLLLLGGFDTEDYGDIQMIYWAILIFLLNVVLLNMLIALMAGTYEKVLDEVALQEAKSKVSMIREAITMKRALFQKKDNGDDKPDKKGYFFYASEGHGDDDDGAGGEWESRINGIRKGFKNDLAPLLKKYDEVASSYREMSIKNDIEKTVRYEQLERRIDGLERKIKKALDTVGLGSIKRAQASPVKSLPKIEEPPKPVQKTRSSLFYMEKK